MIPFPAPNKLHALCVALRAAAMALDEMNPGIRSGYNPTLTDAQQEAWEDLRRAIEKMEAAI